MNMEQQQQLLDVLTKYAVPDPKIVGKLPRGGVQLDFVGHADITRILIEIDPQWRLVPIAWDNGRPAMNIVNDMATMWFELTLLGTSRLAIGSAKSNSPDLDKILYGDALRNGSMRFGIALNLWSKSQGWEDIDHNPSGVMTTRATGEPQQRTMPIATDQPLSEKQLSDFTKACEKAGTSPARIALEAKVNLATATVTDLDKLRKVFKKVKADNLTNLEAEDQADAAWQEQAQEAP